MSLFVQNTMFEDGIQIPVSMGGNVLIGLQLRESSSPVTLISLLLLLLKDVSVV